MYGIEKSLDGSTWTFAFEDFYTAPKNTDFYTITGLEPGRTYYFRMYANNSDGPPSGYTSALPATAAL